MNIFMILITAIFAVLGGGSTLVITGYLFVVLAQKIIRKLKTGASLYS